MGVRPQAKSYLAGSLFPKLSEKVVKGPPVAAAQLRAYPWGEGCVLGAVAMGDLGFHQTARRAAEIRPVWPHGESRWSRGGREA